MLRGLHCLACTAWPALPGLHCLAGVMRKPSPPYALLRQSKSTLGGSLDEIPLSAHVLAIPTRTMRARHGTPGPVFGRNRSPGPGSDVVGVHVDVVLVVGSVAAAVVHQAPSLAVPRH